MFLSRRHAGQRISKGEMHSLLIRLSRQTGLALNLDGAKHPAGHDPLNDWELHRDFSATTLTHAGATP